MAWRVGQQVVAMIEVKVRDGYDGEPRMTTLPVLAEVRSVFTTRSGTEYLVLEGPRDAPCLILPPEDVTPLMEVDRPPGNGG